MLDRLQASGEPLRPQWITHEICELHRTGLVHDDEHAAFWEFSGYTITRKLAGECINERDTGGTDEYEESTQPLLPYDGFARAHLQDYYVVPREGEKIGVPTRDLTDDELDAKAALYRSLSRKLVAHAAELDRFKDWRREHSTRAAS